MYVDDKNSDGHAILGGCDRKKHDDCQNNDTRPLTSIQSFESFASFLINYFYFLVLPLHTYTIDTVVWFQSPKIL